MDCILTLEEVRRMSQLSMQVIALICNQLGNCKCKADKIIKQREGVILSVKSKKYAKNVPSESTEFLTSLQTKCQGVRQKRVQLASVSAVKQGQGLNAIIHTATRAEVSGLREGL